MVRPVLRCQEGTRSSTDARRIVRLILLQIGPDGFAFSGKSGSTVPVRSGRAPRDRAHDRGGARITCNDLGQEHLFIRQAAPARARDASDAERKARSSMVGILVRVLVRAPPGGRLAAGRRKGEGVNKEDNFNQGKCFVDRDAPVRSVTFA